MEFNISDIVLIAGLALTLFNIVDRIVALKTRSQKPLMDLTEKVHGIETEVKDLHNTIQKHAEYLANDNKRFVDLENDIKVKDGLILQSLHTLIRHARTGNNVEELAKVDEDLNKYLFKRG